jgi:hypothetical protein
MKRHRTTRAGGRFKARRANDCRVPAERVENFDRKEGKQEPAPANDDLEGRQRELWRSAAERVKPWGKPQKDDYDFAWIQGESIDVLAAGRVYEYARESSKLRGLLVLMDPKRKREPFEIETRTRTGKELHLPCSFQELNEEDADRTIGSGILGWLSHFADELADNKSFAELLRTREKQVKQFLPKHRLHFPLSTAINLPTFPFEGPLPWPLQTLSSILRNMKMDEGWSIFTLPNRPRPDDEGSETIAVEIRWRDFTNAQITEAMKAFAERNRPPSEPEPKRKGQKFEETIRADLKALSVMRIWKLHAGKPWKRLNVVANVCRYKSCEKEATEDKRRRKAWYPRQPMNQAAKTEMSGARSRALRFFQRLFPGEKPSNY